MLTKGIKTVIVLSIASVSLVGCSSQEDSSLPEPEQTIVVTPEPPAEHQDALKNAALSALPNVTSDSSVTELGNDIDNPSTLYVNLILVEGETFSQEDLLTLIDVSEKYKKDSVETLLVAALDAAGTVIDLSSAATGIPEEWEIDSSTGGISIKL